MVTITIDTDTQALVNLKDIVNGYLLYGVKLCRITIAFVCVSRNNNNRYVVTVATQ